jgi:hypothetical protein
VCFVAVSFLLSFRHVRCRISILSPRLLAVLIQGGMSIVIFSHLGFCHLTSFSRDVDFGLCAIELVVVGIGGFEVGCLL